MGHLACHLDRDGLGVGPGLPWDILCCSSVSKAESLGRDGDLPPERAQLSLTGHLTAPATPLPALGLWFPFLFLGIEPSPWLPQADCEAHSPVV